MLGACTVSKLVLHGKFLVFIEIEVPHLHVDYQGFFFYSVVYIIDAEVI
jgi:hypothetical protein